MRLLTAERVGPLAEAVATDLARRADTWPGRDVVVFDELAETYGGAVLRWAGIDVPPVQARRWSRRLATVDGVGFAGAAYARGWAARTVANRWATRLVDDVHAGRRRPPPDSALGLLAGTGQPARVAAVELLAVLRATVAVAWPGTFAVTALAEHPQWRDSLRRAGTGEDADARGVEFGHEVRRLYPFPPARAGRARRRLKAGGAELGADDRIVLDVADVDPDPSGSVPQGGGDAATGPSSPGEPLTVRLLAETGGVFAGLDYDIVSRSAYDPARMPTRPDRGLVIRVGA